MVSVKNLRLEYKSTALFGILALFLSALTGIISGVGIGTIFIRTLIFTTLFAGIGFAIVIIFRKFVPELYAMLSSFLGRAEKEPEETGDAIEKAAMAEAEKGEDEEEAPDGSGETDNAFTELAEDELTHLKSADVGESLDVDKGKLGKHKIETEKLVQYEPQVLAQAIRTMMSKDED